MLQHGYGTSSGPDISRPERWIHEASKMCDQTICEALPNATSLPGSGFGPWLSERLAGQTRDLFGPAVVRANLSAQQAKELGLMTSGTCGRSGWS